MKEERIAVKFGAFTVKVRGYQFPGTHFAATERIENITHDGGYHPMRGPVWHDGPLWALTHIPTGLHVWSNVTAAPEWWTVERLEKLARMLIERAGCFDWSTDNPDALRVVIRQPWCCNPVNKALRDMVQTEMHGD